jgi:hypothetical protein
MSPDQVLSGLEGGLDAEMREGIEDRLAELIDPVWRRLGWDTSIELTFKFLPEDESDEATALWTYLCKGRAAW